MTLPHYTPRPHGPSMWMFTTPTGSVPNIISEDRAHRLAKSQREQDMTEAYSDMTSPIATVLRLYFDSLTEVE